MQTVVDLTRCQGYAQCVFLAPEVFQLHGEEGLLYATAVPDDQVERVRQARRRARCRRSSSVRR